MPKRSLQGIVDQFVLEITEAVRGDAKKEAAQQIEEKLRQFTAEFGGKAMKGKKASKSKKVSTPRPCPVPGCKDKAYSRLQLVCKKHSEELDRKDILMHRDVAAQPGGIWYKMGLGPHAKAERKKSQTG